MITTDPTQMLDIRALIEILITAVGCTIGAIIFSIWQREQWQKNLAALEKNHQREMKLRDQEWEARDRELQMKHNTEVALLRQELQMLREELGQEKNYRKILSDLIEQQLNIKVPYPPAPPSLAVNAQGDIVIGRDVVGHDSKS